MKTILRYTNLGNTISFNLPIGYIITANYIQPDYHNIPERFLVTFYINEKSVDLLDKIDVMEIIADPKQIKTVIAQRVAYALESGCFDKHYASYDQMLKCFDLGNNILESESIKQDRRNKS